MSTKKPRRSSLEDRMNDQAQGADPEQLARFRAEHGGLDPMQYAMSLFPSAARNVEKEFPHLVPPKRRKPPPAGSR